MSRWTLLTLSDGLLAGVGFQPDGSHWARPHGGPCGRPRWVNCGPGQVRSGQVNSGGRGMSFDVLKTPSEESEQ